MKRIIISDILILFILAILPFYLAGIEGIIIKTDAEFPIYPLKDLSEFSQAWVTRFALGIDNLRYWLLPQIPYYFILSFLGWLGLSINLINRVVLILILFFIGLGGYSLGRYITRDRIAAIASAVFVIYNPNTQRLLHEMYIHILISYCTFPFLVLFILKGMGDRSKGWRYSVFFSITTFFLIITPIPFYISLIPLFLFFSFYLLFKTRSFSVFVADFRYLVVTGILCFFFQLWWLLPFITRGEILVYPYQLKTQLGHLDLTSQNLSNIFMFQYANITPIMIALVIIMWLLIICAFSRKRLVLPWVMLFFISCFLVKGTNPPFGGIYRWLFLNMPGFGIIKSPSHFGYILFLSGGVLLGCGLARFYIIVKGKSSTIFLGKG